LAVLNESYHISENLFIQVSEEKEKMQDEIMDLKREVEKLKDQHEDDQFIIQENRNEIKLLCDKINVLNESNSAY